MKAVSVEHLSFAYPGGRKIVDDVSFSLDQGESLVLAGLSGCGKSTLCRCLCGLIPKSIGGEFSGAVSILGQDLAGLTLARAAELVGLVFQNPDDQLICETVEDELAFGPENLCLPPAEIQRRVDETMERIGIAAWAGKDPSALSGGQKKLVNVASVLIMEPQVVIFDEPMTGLDGESRLLVRRTIDRLLAEGRTVVAVEHDLSLAGYAQRVLYLREGRLYAEA
ncbi:MAG: ABC transporter ATP-binding protein [Firmicutes bacterium]|nr:ABC transporter ATP-binding protein [Bacillota bacterium]